MSYLHIPNLYKATEILMHRECYAMEKIHGSSAHVSWRDGTLHFFAGGCKQVDFEALFVPADLATGFTRLGHPNATVFGEVYGGKLQGMRDTYGTALRFVAFEVKIGDSWLAVPEAEEIARGLGFDFVPWRKVPTDLAILDAERDAPSEQALKLGMGEHPREGIVLRPLTEVRMNNGDRIIAKHKNDAFRETDKTRKVETDPKKLVVLDEANAVAKEWATEMRLTHVLDGFGGKADVEQTGDVIRAMIADIEREGVGEILWTREAKSAIGRQTAEMLKARARAELVAQTSTKE